MTADNLDTEINRLGNTMALYVDKFGMDGREVVTRQAGLLMRDLVEALPPSDKAHAEKSIRKDTLGVFAGPSYAMFPEKNRGSGDMVWLNAGPSFLTGIAAADYRMSASAADMLSTYEASRPGRGKKYVRMGTRGKQYVQRLNRFLVRAGQLAAFIKRQVSRIGKMKASFAIGWDAYGPKGKRPAKWIMDHVQDGSAKGAAFPGFGIPNVATFTLVSNAKGIERDTAIQAVRRAVHNRIEKIKLDVARIVKYGPGKAPAGGEE